MLTISIEYAAAFFLLADHLQDAVNVCLNQMKDLQLAIAVARVYEGDQGPVLRRLLEHEVLVIASQEGNRWLASWAFWMLHRKDMAVRALVVSLQLRLQRRYELTHCKDTSIYVTRDSRLPRSQVQVVPHR